MGSFISINPTPSGDIVGSGTANTIAMFTAVNTVGNSIITQNSLATSVAFTPLPATGGSATPYTLTFPSSTALSANTETIGMQVGGGTMQFINGTTATERLSYFKSTTLTGTLNPTTFTNAYGVYIEAPTAGTNAAITNNYALGLAGNLYIGTFNVVTDTTTGTIFGTATSQKMGWYNAPPVVQQTTGVATSTFVANTSGIANDTATFGGYKISQIVKALQIYGFLA